MPIVKCGLEACRFRKDEYCQKEDHQEIDLGYGSAWRGDEGTIEFLICQSFEWPEVGKCSGQV